MTIKGIIFDMDGLLLDTETVVYQSQQAAAETLEMAFSKEVYLRYLGTSDAEFVEKFHQDFDSRYGVEKVTAFIKLAYQISEEKFAKGAVALKPGVEELLAYIEEKQLKKILASSNNRKAIDGLLAQKGLAATFDQIVSANDVTRAKPDPEIFLTAAKKLALPKEELLVLEDSQHGVNAAVAAKIPVIMVPDLLAPDEALAKLPLAVLPDLHEVKLWLAEN